MQSSTQTKKKRPKRKESPFKKDFRLEPLVPVIRGEMRCRIHCHRADDILTAIRISEEFGLDYVLEHCTEGFKVADILAEKKAKCCCRAFEDDTLKNGGLELHN